MKKSILLIILLLTISFVYSQTKWQNGFNKGFEEGYCYNDIGCVSPPPPASIPNINSEYNNYKDGYNQGFAEGQRKKQNDNSKNANQQGRERYKTAKPTFVDDFVYNPYANLDNAMALANAIRKSKGRALEHLKNEEYQEAAKICFAGLRARPNDSEFMMVLGQTYRMYGDKKNALLWLRKSKRLRPNDENLRQLITSLDKEYTAEIKKTINETEYAIINIYRPKKMMGSMLSVDVLIDGELVAKLHSGGHLKYKVYDLSPKKITIKSAGIATIKIAPRKDKIYYFETKPKFSGFTLEQIEKSVPEKKLKKKRFITKADFVL